MKYTIIFITLVVASSGLANTSYGHFPLAAFATDELDSKNSDNEKVSVNSDRLPPIPVRVTSFGAAVAAHAGKIYAIGGMRSKGGPTTRVDVFDTESQIWSRGPGLVGEGMDGFGSSSFATGGKLYVTTYSGALQRLNRNGDSWKVISKLDHNRFFHRLLPLSHNQLIAADGASMTSGKFEKIDVIQLD